MRKAKYMTLMIMSLLVLTVIGCSGCGEKTETVPSAAETMEKYKAVRIGTDPAHAPFEFGSGTGVQGYDVDIGNEIGKEIAKDLGLEVRWIKISGYEKLYESLKKGEVELVISAMAIDPKRTEDFAFSNPYYETGDAIAHQRNKFDIKNLADLAGKKVGVGAGRPADSFMTTQTTAGGAALTKKATLDDALGALNRGEVDAVVGDEAILTYSSFKSFPNTQTIPNLLVNKYQYGAVVRKNETELLKKINDTLDRMKSSGELAKLQETWFQKVMREAQAQREKDEAAEALKKAPKTINVTINKLGGSWNMDRLDGFVLVLEGPNGRYQSEPILTSGNKGHCRFTRAVPPGDYKLNMSIFKMVKDVPVPELSKGALAMEMNISTSGIVISFK